MRDYTFRQGHIEHSLGYRDLLNVNLEIAHSS